MLHLATKIGWLLRREEGPTAVEYAVLLALVILVCLAGIRTVDTAAHKKTDKAVNSTAN